MNPNPTVPASILRHRPFVLYWSARTCAAMGYQMLGVAVAWQMYALTGSAFDLGLVGLMQFLPSAAFMLVAGQIADRYDRRRLLQLCQTVEGLAAAALAVGSVSGWVSKEFILAAVFVLGVGRAFEAPTQSDIAAQCGACVVVSARGRGFGLDHSARDHRRSGRWRRTLHPRPDRSLHDLLRALSRLGRCCWPSSSSSVCVATRTPVSLAAFFAGISYIRHNPIVLGVISLDLFAVLLGGTTALLPIFADEVFHLGSEGLGLLRASPAIGALAIMALLTTFPLTRRVGLIMFASVACFGLATIVFALSKSFILSMIALAVLGAADAVSVVIRMTLVQIETPDDMRGRVNAVNSLFAGTSNQLGDFRAGTMAAWLGAIPAVLVGRRRNPGCGADLDARLSGAAPRRYVLCEESSE